jgi:hypothetical protein
MDFSMAYAGISSKKKRTVERDVETLFSPRAFHRASTFEEIKHLQPFPPHIKFKGGICFLSEKGVAAFGRLVDLLSALPKLVDVVSTREINAQLQSSYKTWLENALQPTGQEFIESIVNSLMGQVKCYNFLVKIEGIDLKNQDILSLGSVRVQRCDPALFDNLKFEGNLDLGAIYSEFKDSLWLIASAKGSADVASEKFEYRALLTVGILGVCGALLYKGAIWRSRVRVVTSPLEHRKAVTTLMWDVPGDRASLSRNFGTEQDLPFTAESLAHLNDVCFLAHLSSLPDRNDRSELENAIILSIYWFAESYRDRTQIMQFIKLWTCIECFFSIQKKDVVEMNAKGVSGVLVFSGFGIIDVAGHSNLKRRIKRLYDLRSRVVHGEEFGCVDKADLEELSNYAAWVVISMVSLVERGYETLQQLHEQVSRLDRLSSGAEM